MKTGLLVFVAILAIIAGALVYKDGTSDKKGVDVAFNRRFRASDQILVTGHDVTVQSNSNAWYTFSVNSTDYEANRYTDGFGKTVKSPGNVYLTLNYGEAQVGFVSTSQYEYLYRPGGQTQVMAAVTAFGAFCLVLIVGGAISVGLCQVFGWE